MPDPLTRSQSMLSLPRTATAPTLKRASSFSGKSSPLASWMAYLDLKKVSETDRKKLNETEVDLEAASGGLREALELYDKYRSQQACNWIQIVIYGLRQLPSSTMGFALKQHLAKLVFDVLREEKRVRPPTALPETDFPTRVVQSLAATSDYACLDASTFPNAVNQDPTCKYRVLNLCWASGYDTERAHCYSAARTHLNARKTYTVRDLVYAKQLTDRGRCGICTTFSAAAAGHLIDGLATSSSKYRVECVSPEKGNHCFVILDRRGGLTNGLIAPPTQQDWGRDWLVVDTWAASLGHDFYYHGVVEWKTMHSFIKEHLLNPLNQHFDSSSVEGLKEQYDAVKDKDIDAEMQKRRGNPAAA